MNAISLVASSIFILVPVSYALFHRLLELYENLLSSDFKEPICHHWLESQQFLQYTTTLFLTYFTVGILISTLRSIITRVMIHWGLANYPVHFPNSKFILPSLFYRFVCVFSWFPLSVSPIRLISKADESSSYLDIL